MSYTFLDFSDALRMPSQAKALRLPSSQDFSQLVHFPALEALQCTVKASTSEAEWAMFSQLPHLQTLHIDLINATVPEAFFACKELKELHIEIKGTFAVSQDRFAEFQALENFTLTERYDTAPDTILRLPSVFQIKSLRSLAFSVTRLKDLPQDAFTQLKNLESLELTYAKADEARLTSIFSCGKLQKLGLYLQKYAKGAVPFETLPSSIGTLTHLTELAITGHKFKTLPDCVNQLTNLESLNLYGNHFTDLPFQPASFPKLHSLSLIQNKIQTLPLGLIELANLQTLDLQSNPIARHPVYRKGMPVLAFIKKIKSLGAEARQIAWTVFAENTAAIQALTATQLLEATVVDSPTFQRSLHAVLNQRLVNPFAAAEPAGLTVWLTGRRFFGLTREELTERLQMQGVGATDTLSPEVTHIVLGEVIAKNSISRIAQTSLPLATAEHLKQWLEHLENPYLKQADDSLMDNLWRLLVSGEENNVKVALQMIESGGIPESLLYRVFCLCFFKSWGEYNQAPDLRRTFEKTGPPELVDLTKLHWQKGNNRLVSLLFAHDGLDKKRLFEAAFDLLQPALERKSTEEDPMLNPGSWWIGFFRSVVIKISQTEDDLADYVLALCKEKKVLETLLQSDSRTSFSWLASSGKIQQYVAALLIKDKTLDIRQQWMNITQLPFSLHIETLLIDDYWLAYASQKPKVSYLSKMIHLKRVLVKKKGSQRKLEDALRAWATYAPHIDVVVEDESES